LDTSLYVFDLVIAHVREWGFHFATEFCWERVGVPKAVSQRFKNQFEPVYQFVKNRWKMRPEAVRHKSDAVPKPFGRGAGDTSWATRQGGAQSLFGPDQVRRHGSAGNMAKMQGTRYEPGETIGPGLAYPGNRLPTFSDSHQATGHAAAFPVGLPGFFLQAFSDEGDVVLDPFAGSGSTLIAAELTGRVGLMVELSPAYCDVIAARFEQQTGIAAAVRGQPRRHHLATALDAG
jgi:site-specific DNA-methyltransferase (adenine-specific)/site-specific DNA-methyltransferase (cytosine-N4-specific)